MLLGHGGARGFWVAANARSMADILKDASQDGSDLQKNTELRWAAGQRAVLGFM